MKKRIRNIVIISMVIVMACSPMVSSADSVAATRAAYANTSVSCDLGASAQSYGEQLGTSQQTEVEQLGTSKPIDAEQYIIAPPAAGEGLFADFITCKVRIEAPQFDDVQGVTIPTDDPTINIILAVVKVIDSAFTTDDYLMDVNMFAGQSGMITFLYCPNEINTGKAYMAVIENGIVTEVMASEVASAILRGEIEDFNNIEYLIQLVNEHKAAISCTETSVPVENFLEEKSEYYYDIWTDTLYYEKTVFYTNPSAGGVICDITTETILNK